MYVGNARPKLHSYGREIFDNMPGCGVEKSCPAFADINQPNADIVYHAAWAMQNLDNQVGLQQLIICR